MTQIGDSSDPVTLIIKLGVCGPIATRVGQNICWIIGEASHGPALTPMALTSSSQFRTYFRGGDLCRAGELAKGQGTSIVGGIRVLGNNYATATVDTYDSQVAPVKTGSFDAANDGVAGNAGQVLVSYGTRDSPDVGSFHGTGTDEYFLDYDDYTGDTDDWVRVDAVDWEIVYTAPELAAGKVYHNKVAGSLTFYTGEEIDEDMQVTYNLAHKTRKLLIYEGEERPITIDHIFDSVGLVAALADSAFVHYTPDETNTHLPAPGLYQLDGGLDGDAITTADWALALDALMTELDETSVGATSVVFCANEVLSGTNDLIPVLDLGLQELEGMYLPCLGFIGLTANTTEANAIRIASNYNNRLLSIVPNPWDTTEPDRMNGAVARAATEAACALGESAGLLRNAMHGMNGLLTSFGRPAVKDMTLNGLDVIVKRSGAIVPKQGISCDLTQSYVRCVDNRTINAIIIAIRIITDQFYFEKNDPPEQASLKQSIAGMLDELITGRAVKRYRDLTVAESVTNPWRVDIHMDVMCMNHMEYFVVAIDTGTLI